MTIPPLPDPLVDREVDLRDFGFMPLDVVRLRDSGLATKASGDAFRAAVILWCAAWHQVPASSLPDDDHELAKLAGYGRDVRSWRKIRVDALHNFIKCSDGLLYHKVIAEKAREAWNAKLAQRAKTAAATEARILKAAARRAEEEGLKSERNGDRDDQRDGHAKVDRDVHQGKGQGQGQGQGDNTSLRSGEGRSIGDRFADAYPADVAPDGVERELARRIGEGVDPEDIIAGAVRYAKTVAGKPADKIANPVNWLRDGRWKDGARKSTSVAVVSNTSFVRRTDANWERLSNRHRIVKGKSPPEADGGWYFPNEWIAELHAGAA